MPKVEIEPSELMKKIKKFLRTRKSKDFNNIIECLKNIHEGLKIHEVMDLLKSIDQKEFAKQIKLLDDLSWEFIEEDNRWYEQQKRRDCGF